MRVASERARERAGVPHLRAIAPSGAHDGEPTLTRHASIRRAHGARNAAERALHGRDSATSGNEGGGRSRPNTTGVERRQAGHNPARAARRRASQASTEARVNALVGRARA
jgi:hypothetical protein